MKKIIICVHGLHNKPPRIILEKWWKQAIKEGLWEIGHPRFFLNVIVAYWAHFLYSEPLDVTEENPDNPLYVDQPYVPAKNYVIEQPVRIGKILFDRSVTRFEKLIFNKTKYFNLNVIGHWFIKRRFKDLDSYYNKVSIDENKLERPVKEIIRNDLAGILRKHKEKDILLIAQSMGSIIAYDVLTLIAPDVKIHTFISIGSPLGNSLLKNEIIEEQKEVFHGETRLTTPESVQYNWYNFNDAGDNISINHTLKNEFKPNARHVEVIDMIVNNNYEYKGIKTPHRSYGYLRTPELAGVIHKFLCDGKETFLDKTRSKIMKRFAKSSQPNNPPSSPQQ